MTLSLASASTSLKVVSSDLLCNLCSLIFAYEGDLNNQSPLLRHFCNRIAKKFVYGCIRVSSIVYSCILLSTVVFTYRGCEIVGYGILILSFKLFNRKSRVIYLEQIEHLPRFEHYLIFPLWGCSIEHGGVQLNIQPVQNERQKNE
jgi:hypothetical protein